MRADFLGGKGGGIPDTGSTNTYLYLLAYFFFTVPIWLIEFLHLIIKGRTKRKVIQAEIAVLFQ